MTTTNIYTGLQGDKSTSRVLRPPGGGSSNIFGNPEPAAAAPQSKQKPSDSNIFGAPSASATMTPKPQKSAENNIYGASPTKEPTPVATKPAEVDEEKPATEEQDTEQNNNADKPAEPQEESPAEQALNDSASNFETAQKLQKRNQAINPITGTLPGTPTEKENSPVFNPITGEEMRSPEKIGDHASSAKYQTSIGTFNPITGASLEPTKTSVPSTKVRQPPGGASSGLW